MDLIYTNQNREDIGVLHDFSLDLAFGSGENDFELTVSRENNVAQAGCYIYIQGTEYGGIIDAVKSDTGTAEVTYSGRTWHGILNSKILEPDSGQAYLTVSGDANTVLATLIARMGLGALFKALSTHSGITVKSYQFDRYVSGYNGILKMLKAVGAKLRIVHNGTNVVISAVPVTDYTQDGVSDDQTALTVLKTKNKVNHLICLGTGELADRMVIHLYADAAGKISRTQTFTGLDEYTAVYDYSSVESEDDLVSGGTERFKELLQQDQLDVNFPESDDIYSVGDIVGATDNVTGISIAVPVTKKIVKIEGDLVSVAIETSTESVSAQASTGGGGGGGGGSTLTPGAVTTDILADGAVTNDKIADGTIDESKLSFSVPSLLDIYPVGAIYLSVSSTSPETLFGGIWEQIQDRFLLAAGSSYPAGETGGEATHTLTTDEMPSHAHNFSRGNGTYTGYAIVDMAESVNSKWGVHWETQSGYWCNNGQMQNTGGGAAHNNMPPYLAVYVWKRTA